MAWMTQLPNVSALRQALKDPDLLFVTGYLGGVSRTTSLSSLMEDIDRAVIEGPAGWRAEIWKEGRRLRMAPIRQNAKPRKRAPWRRP